MVLLIIRIDMVIHSVIWKIKLSDEFIFFFATYEGVGNTRPAKDTTQNFVATPSVIQINGALTAVNIDSYAFFKKKTT